MSDFAQSVKQQADIVRVIGEYITLKKSGAQNYQGLCPFHGEKTPSFSVHVTRQFYHCFGCGVSGDVFKFVQEIEKVNQADPDAALNPLSTLLARRDGHARRRGGRAGAGWRIVATWNGSPPRGASCCAGSPRRRRPSAR